MTDGIERMILPDDCTPVSYDLTLTVDLKTCTFVGSVDILLDVTVATNTISLNYNKLTVCNTNNIFFFNVFVINL